MLQRCWQDLSLPKFHGFEIAAPNMLNQNVQGWCGGCQCSEWQDERESCSHWDPKTWICLLGWCFLPFYQGKHHHQSSMCLCLFNWICFLGNVLLILSHGESSPWSQPPLKGEYVWFTFSKDLKSKPKGSKNCLIFFFPCKRLPPPKKKPGLVGDIFCRRFIWVGGYVGSLGFVERWLSILCHGKPP